MDLEYIYETMSVHDGENPLDYHALAANPGELIVVATDADTGEAAYFTKNDMRQDDYRILMGSSAIPVACKPFQIGEHRYFDGALSDCIPIGKAMSHGCERIVLILSKPVSEVRDPKRDARLAKMIRRKYPYAARGLINRADTYNSQIERAKRLQRDGRLLIVSPSSTGGVDTLSRNAEKLDALYRIRKTILEKKDGC